MPYNRDVVKRRPLKISRHAFEEKNLIVDEELQKMAVKVSDACIGCGACIDTCPVGALEMVDDKAVCNENCSECGACVDVCPVEALSL